MKLNLVSGILVFEPTSLAKSARGDISIKLAEERVFRASAWAQARTGVEIPTHTSRRATLALEQIALLEVFDPLLKERCVTDEQIHQMLVVNPANAFSKKLREV